MNSSEKNLPQHGWVLSVIIFLMGGCGLAYEYTFSKIASDLLGNSVQQWAIIIAVMLFFMGVGSEIQRYISDKKVVSSLLYSQLLLALLGGFGPILMLWAFTSAPYQYGLVHYGLTSMMGIIIGFEIPLISRINERYSDDIGNNLARVLKMDYIGALAGALLWVFCLPKFFSLNETAFVLAFVSLASTLFCWFYFARVNHRKVLFLTAFVGVCGVLGFGISQTNQWALTAEQKIYKDRIVYAETTPYQHIVLTQSKHGNFRCYINGHIQFSANDEHIYHEHLVHPAMAAHRHPRNILILGGGDGLAVREVLKYPSVEKIMLVDLDPAMTRLAAEHPLFTKLNDSSLTSDKVTVISAGDSVEKGDAYLLERSSQNRSIHGGSLSDKPELSVLNIDASKYVEQASGLFDVIICDFPDPSSPELAKLYSMHFYGALMKKLAHDGYLVQQSTSPYRAKDAFLCIGRTMQSVGLAAVPYHDHVPSFGEWGWWIATHPGYADEAQLRQRLLGIKKLPDYTRYLTPDIIKSSLSFGKEDLDTSETDITTITNSAVLNHYLNGWIE
ncbi:MAG: polyamine aminopropyltransferase [Akkermansiaceae bacterium]